MAWDFQSLFRRHAPGIARSLRRRGLEMPKLRRT